MKFRPLGDRVLVRRVEEARLDAQVREGVLELRVRASVEFTGSHEVVARRHEREESVHLRRLS